MRSESEAGSGDDALSVKTGSIDFIPASSSRCKDFGSRKSLAESRDSNAKSASTIFGDGDCGEPAALQHLVIDFTPIDEVDTDFVQEKCCAFWDFLNSHPELQKLIVEPGTNLDDDESIPSEDTMTESVEEDLVSTVGDNRTAVSMLEIVQGNKLIHRAFDTRLPQTSCSLGSREYHEKGSRIEGNRRRPGDKGLEFVCCCGKEECCCVAGASCFPLSQTRPATPTDETADLGRLMDSWDKQHPKSMEPPGHSPALTKCVMQRKIVS